MTTSNEPASTGNGEAFDDVELDGTSTPESKPADEEPPVKEQTPAERHRAQTRVSVWRALENAAAGRLSAQAQGRRWGRR